MDEIPEDWRVAVTHHALARYRERFRASGRPEDVERLVRESGPVPARLRRWCRDANSARSDSEQRLAGDVLLVLVRDPAESTVVVLTVLSAMGIEERQRRQKLDRGKSSAGVQRGRKHHRSGWRAESRNREAS